MTNSTDVLQCVAWKLHPATIVPLASPVVLLLLGVWRCCQVQRRPRCQVTVSERRRFHCGKLFLMVLIMLSNGGFATTFILCPEIHTHTSDCMWLVVYGVDILAWVFSMAILRLEYTRALPQNGVLQGWWVLQLLCRGYAMLAEQALWSVDVLMFGQIIGHFSLLVLMALLGGLFPNDHRFWKSTIRMDASMESFASAGAGLLGEEDRQESYRSAYAASLEDRPHDAGSLTREQQARRERESRCVRASTSSSPSAWDEFLH